MENYFPTVEDVFLFHEGTMTQCYKMMGAHPVELNGVAGVRFRVWAPHAREVRVAGNFNGWSGFSMVLVPNSGGIWVLFVPGIGEWECYKYEIHTYQGEVLYKADPYAFYSEQRPATASLVFNHDRYEWHDSQWMEGRKYKNTHQQPLNIYEVHLGTWKQKEGRLYTYRELAVELVDYVVEMGYTHIELLPLTEHPFDLSWGYQSTGYYSITSRYGTPDDFKYFVDRCHQRGIGVIMDWVPGHFCKDAHGLRCFDGTPLYEPSDPRKGEKEFWGTLSFDLAKPAVNSFLLSNAMFWFDVFHIDGLRVDAVASMLYFDFGKEHGNWVPNEYGGRENIEAVSFFRKLNEFIFESYPEALMMAEESTAWPLVSAPTYLGGLGFNYKWNMGWMNDTLRYMEMDPIHRKGHHDLLTFSSMYAYSENYILPFSHDEVVHGKKSLLNKMPGDYWQKFANLRLLFGYMFAHPGKKLMFMGGEFGQFIEWKDTDSLDWFLLDYDMHRKLHSYVRELNYFYRQQPAFWELDQDPLGFSWIDADNRNQSILVFMRKGQQQEHLLVVCNFTPVVYHHYRVGLPFAGVYQEVLNSDNHIFGGSGVINGGEILSQHISWHDQPYSMSITISPLSFCVFKRKETKSEGMSP